MKKLTKKEKARIIDSCEKAETIGDFSCLLLEYGFAGYYEDYTREETPERMPELVEKYADFYSKSKERVWDFEHYTTDEGKHERIMAMLFFMEANS